MVPENTASSSSPPPKGEEADVALQLLKELGYSLDHPLLPSLLAHITRKPAWQQKEELEHFLAHHAVMKTDHNEEKRQRLTDEALAKLRDDERIQKALTVASYTGCNLVYAEPSKSSPQHEDL